MTLSETSVKRPILTIILYLGIIVLGFVSYQRLSIDLLPEIELPMISVLLPIPGRARKILRSIYPKQSRPALVQSAT
jgi:HAE1 family hydrophobic/amphiphilic exporter-1